MKYKYDSEIEVPFEEKSFILPEPRIKLFQNMLENFKIFCPAITLTYAYLNFNSKNPIDYLIMFTATSNGTKILLWDVPYLYSNKTIPAYRYICKNNLFEQYFKYVSQSICRMSYNKFLEYIPSNLCKLSTDPNSPKYWRKQENADILVKAMSDLALQYTPAPGQSGVSASKYTKDEIYGKK